MRISSFIQAVLLSILAPFALASAQTTEPSSLQSPPPFRPGELWPDTSGTPINAHGGGLLFRNGT